MIPYYIKPQIKHFTFLIVFRQPDGNTSSASFCETDKDAAINAFNIWYGVRSNVPAPMILAIMVIYSASDHERYGELYGQPGEYAA